MLVKHYIFLGMTCWHNNGVCIQSYAGMVPYACPVVHVCLIVWAASQLVFALTFHTLSLLPPSYFISRTSRPALTALTSLTSLSLSLSLPPLSFQFFFPFPLPCLLFFLSRLPILFMFVDARFSFFCSVPGFNALTPTPPKRFWRQQLWLTCAQEVSTMWGSTHDRWHKLYFVCLSLSVCLANLQNQH